MILQHFRVIWKHAKSTIIIMPATRQRGKRWNSGEFHSNRGFSLDFLPIIVIDTDLEPTVVVWLSLWIYFLVRFDSPPRSSPELWIIKYRKYHKYRKASKTQTAILVNRYRSYESVIYSVMMGDLDQSSKIGNLGPRSYW